MTVCHKNLLCAQDLQKQAHNKGVKPKSYVPSNKVWLKSKYIKIKQKRKLETTFLGLFQVLHIVEKQVYKLELPKKWKIHDIFYVSLLEQDNTRKGRVKETQLKLDTGNSKEYKVEAIWDSAVYGRESKSGHLLEFYYLISWKSYPKEENTWELASTVQHLRKLISSFHKKQFDKPITMFPTINTAAPMARPTIKFTEPPK